MAMRLDFEDRTGSGRSGKPVEAVEALSSCDAAIFLSQILSLRNGFKRSRGSDVGENLDQEEDMTRKKDDSDGTTTATVDKISRGK